MKYTVVPIACCCSWCRFEQERRNSLCTSTAVSNTYTSTSVSNTYCKMQIWVDQTEAGKNETEEKEEEAESSCILEERTATASMGWSIRPTMHARMYSSAGLDRKRRWQDRTGCRIAYIRAPRTTEKGTSDSREQAYNCKSCRRKVYNMYKLYNYWMCQVKYTYITYV